MTHAYPVQDELDRIVGIIERIDFYGWDFNTQRMIKEKIIKAIKT